MKQSPTTAPALPIAAANIPAMKPKRNTKKIENLEERRLLLQVIAEARAFCRADMRKRQDGQK